MPRLRAAAITLVLAGCASTGPAPVTDLGSSIVPAGSAARAPAPTKSGMHRVVRGDTLYSIAFRNELDYRELAAWNGIASPYTIYVDQELRLQPPARPAAAASPAALQPVPASRPAPGPFVDAPAAAAPEPAAPIAPAPQPPAAEPERAVASQADAAAPTRAAGAVGAPASPTTEPAAELAAVPATPVEAIPAESVARPTPSAVPPAAPQMVVGNIAWRWPAPGRVLSGFQPDDRTRQGIDIGGRAGEPIRATAAGAVVYSGNGLIGYGELIIIKHSPDYLSAYGYNRKRLVKEGEQVQAGQVIAEMGASSAGRDALHFEIRRKGKPTNPLDFLPRR